MLDRSQQHRGSGTLVLVIFFLVLVPRAALLPALEVARTPHPPAQYPAASKIFMKGP